MVPTFRSDDLLSDEAFDFAEQRNSLVNTSQRPHRTKKEKGSVPDDPYDSENSSMSSDTNPVTYAENLDDLGQDQTSLEVGPRLWLYQEAQGCYPLEWNREKGQHFDEIIFQDDQFITDAVIESWYHNLQTELSGGGSITLKRCVSVTDWGLHWLAKMLRERSGIQKVTLDGCNEVTERGLLELCGSGPTLELSCNNTRVTSLPDIVVKQNPQHRFQLQNCPLLATSVFGVDTEEKFFGPYNKVYIHQNSLSTGNLLNGFHHRGKSPKQPSVSMVTDWSTTVPEAEDTLEELRNKPVKLNIIEASESDPSYGLTMGEEADQVIIPFDINHDFDKVATMATRTIVLNAGKERPRLNSGLAKLNGQTGKLNLPTPLWSLQLLLGCTVDFTTGIIDVLPGFTERKIGFAEHFSSYQDKLEMQVLEYTAEEDDGPGMTFVVKETQETARKYTKLKIKAGDYISAEYETEKITVKLNDQVCEAVGVGVPGIDFNKSKNLQLKLKIINFSVVPKTAGPQHFTAKYSKNTAAVFDPQSRTVRYVLGKQTDKQVVVFSGIQPITKSQNTVTIRLVNLGESSTISLGLAGSSYPALGQQPGWKEGSCALHMDDLRIFSGKGSSTDNVDRKITVAKGDLIKMVVDDMPNDVIKLHDKVTLTYYHNGEEFVKRQWTFLGSHEVVVPVIGFHSVGECVELVDFVPSQPLHHRIMEQLGPDKAFITYGKGTCKLVNNTILTSDKCTHRQQEYFRAGNSVSKAQPVFWIKSLGATDKAVLSMGLVQENYNFQSDMPGEKLGTAAFSCGESRNKVAVLKSLGALTEVFGFTLSNRDSLGLGFKSSASDVLYDEYGLPCADQKLTAVFFVNDKKVAEHKFLYLGGGLFPVVAMGSPNIGFTVTDLLGKGGYEGDQLRAVNLPIEPGTQYILTGLCQGAQNKGQWQQKVDAISEKVRSFCANAVHMITEEKNFLWKKSQVTFSDHKHLSVISQQLYNLTNVLEQWEKRIHFILIDPQTKEGISQLGDLLAKNLQYSVQHHMYMYLYTEDTYTALTEICELKSEKIVTLTHITDMFPDLSQPWLVETYLKRLHRWGKVLLFLDQDPALVVTDPEWFLSVLSMLPDQSALKAGSELSFLKAGTPVRKPRELLQASQEKLDRKKLLQVLVESHQLLRLKPFRNEKTDPKYYLLQLADLGAVPSESALKKYLPPYEKSEEYLAVSKRYRFKQGEVLPYMWFAVLARLTEFCEPKMLWNEGLVWHQGPVECVLVAENTDAILSCIELRARVFVCSTKRDDVTDSVRLLVDGLFSMYTDIVDATLYQHGVFGHQSTVNVQVKGDLALHAEHNWMKPFEVEGNSVCTLCSNCCNWGLRCDFNGVLDDKPLTCLCESESTCCFDCGICPTCARKLWNYRTLLRPGNLKDIKGRDGAVNRLSDFPVDGIVVREFQFTPQTASSANHAVGLVSEDQEFYIVWSHHKAFKDCPKSVYKIPMVYGHMNVFTQGGHNDLDNTHTYKVKLSEPEIPLKDKSSYSLGTEKYNFDHMNRMRFYQETGIAECEADSWTGGPDTGYIVALHPLTPKCFYFEAELMATGSEGHVQIGFSERGHFHKAHYGFLTNPTDSIMGDLMMKQRYVHHSPLQEGTKLGVGILFKEDEDKNTVFFVKNGERQSYQSAIMSSTHELFPYIGVSGRGWRVRLTTRGAWRAKNDEVHEVLDMEMDKAKKTQAWSSFDNIEISPASVLQFYTVAPGKAEIKEKIKAELFIKAKSQSKRPVLFKVKVTKLDRYVVRPNKGILKDGETMVLEFFGSCSKFESLAGDKFRVEWLEDKLGTTIAGNGEDDVALGSQSAKWTLGWTENLALKKNPDVITLTCKMNEAVATDLENSVINYVKKVYECKTQSFQAGIPQPLPKVTEGSPDTPHYILDVYQDGQLCSQSWLPKKKYYLAAAYPPNTLLGTGSVRVEGFHIPRLPRSSLPSGFTPGMKVYAKFTDDLFRAAISSDTFNSAFKKGNDAVAGKKKAVGFESEVVNIASEDSKDPEISKRNDDISAIYGPCRVVQVLPRTLVLEWRLGSLCLEKKPDHAWRRFEANISDLHSEMWAEKMNSFTSQNIESKFFDTSKTVAVWSAVPVFKDGDYKWDKTHKSSAMSLTSDNTYQRTATANQTDGIRGETGVSSGTHVFRFENLSKVYGSYFQIGVCTAKAKMQMKKYGLLLGADKNSWAWNLPDGYLYHNNEKVAKAPRSATDKFTIDMKLNIKDPNWPFIQYSIPGQEASGFVAFQDTNMSQIMMAGEKLYPCCAGVYGNHQVKISLVYSNSLLTSDPTDNWEKIGIYKPKKLEAKFENVPLPYLFPSEKDSANFSSYHMIKELTERMNSTSVSASKCCLKPASLTVRQRELSRLFSETSSERQDLLTGFVWVPLPRELDTSLLMYPALEDLVEIDKLFLHFLCKQYDHDLIGVITERFRLHFIDRPATKPVTTLSEDLCFGVPAIACAYLASLKVLLPKYEHLLPEESVRSIPRKYVEHLMQGVLRLLSGVMMTNYPSQAVTGAVHTDGWQAIVNEGPKIMESFTACIDGALKEKLQPKYSKDWLCSTHQVASQFVSGESMTQIGDQKNVLDLKVYEPYNELLTKMELQSKDSGLEVIPDEFQTYFPNLTSLVVDQSNELKKLPASLGKLKKLSTFWFTTEDNINTDKLPDDLGECKALTQVWFIRAHIKQLPSSFTKAQNLKNLSLASNGLITLPEDIEKLRRLNDLQLNFNPISTLPKSIGQLKLLTTLKLSGIGFLPTKSRYHERDLYQLWFDNQGADITKVLPKNREMELYEACKEDKGENQVTNLHKINAHLFYEVPRLGLDYINGDEDGGIPEPIFQLENLETLDLSNQAIRFVPPQIEKLTRLEKLILGKNMLLHSICGEIGSMQKLRAIGVRNCPSLKTPPPEIVGRGVEAIKAFMRRLAGGTTENWRTKLMLVGLGGAGKTSLLRALTSPNHKTSGTSADEITDGIDIKTWTVKSSDSKKITFSTWDFAGQDVYYNTHQFFLSGRAVYLLLWTCRLGFQHAGLDFWLSSIQCHAPKAPIFVIGTHCDQVAKAELPKDLLMKKYPQIKGFHFVSSIKGTGIADLEKQVIETTKLESYMGESIPTVYLNLENKIMQLRKSKKVVPWSDVESLALECGIFELKDIKRAVSFLHDLGAVQYFDNEFLRDRVVINPQWIVDVMACVVSIKDSPIENGTFKHEDIKKVWKDYPEDLHEWLLRLTEEFDLTFPIPSQPINLVPCLLPETEPKFEWPEVCEGERETMMLYKFTYLPAGLFNRTQVRLFELSDGKDIWKRGSLLRKNGHLALIKQLNDKELFVRVQGPRPENILFLIHEVVESLVIESFSGITYDFLIPCPDCIKKTRISVQETAFFEASLIKKAAEWNAPFLQCREHFHTLSMSVLQAHLPPDRSMEFDVHLSQSVRALQNLRRSCTTDVFMLYCDSDVTQEAIHPKSVATDLKKAGLSSHYKENLAQVGIEELMLDLKDSKMIVVFMSDNFEKDKKCHELFLYAKHSMSKPYQVVAYGNSLNWMETHLGGMEIGKHHVFVKMTEKKRYDSKIKELETQVTSKLTGLKKTSTYPRCFLSYCWSNSHDAVKTGSKTVPGALGWEKGDPRDLKKVLEEKGISCWLDTEQTGKVGLFEDISQGILHADMMIACVSDQYKDSKNCMMELRYAECTLEKPILAVTVGTGNEWRFSEIQTLLHRSKADIVSMQTPNEFGLEQIVQHTKDILASCGEKKTMTKKPEKTAKSSLKMSNISFHEEFELAQRKLLRHVSFVAATMETIPYPRLIVLDLKKKQEDVEDASAAQEQQQTVERSKSSLSLSQESRQTLHRRDTKQMRIVTDYDSSWTDSPLTVRLLCEYDGGCHLTEEEVELSQDLSGAEKEGLVKSWSQYLGPVYALLKHSTVTLNMMAMQQGSHIQSFVNYSIDDSELDFAQAYVEMREHVMLADKDRIMGGLDRCYLPTGQIRWLCKEHQEGYRITVLSNDVDVGVRLGDGELVTEDDRLIAAHIDKMSEMSEPYRRKRSSQNPKRMAHTADQFQEYDPSELIFDDEVSAKTKKQVNSTDDVQLSRSTDTNSSHTTRGQTDQDKDLTSTENVQPLSKEKNKPKPKPRQSLIGSKDRPVSAKTKAKMMAGALALQPGSEEMKNSQACSIL